MGQRLNLLVLLGELVFQSLDSLVGLINLFLGRLCLQLECVEFLVVSINYSSNDPQRITKALQMLTDIYSTIICQTITHLSELVHVELLVGG